MLQGAYCRESIPRFLLMAIMVSGNLIAILAKSTMPFGLVSGVKTVHHKNNAAINLKARSFLCRV